MGNHFRKMSDEELTEAAADGKKAAFDEIIRRYCRGLTNFAGCRTGKLQDAEDIVQETFLRAYQNINSFEKVYSLKNWLFTIAYRLIVSGYRKKRPELLSKEAAARLSDGEAKSEDYGWLWEAVRKMGNEPFTVLWLYYKVDMSTKEIARVMNKSKVMVRVLLHRSRKSLAERISTHSETAEKTKWLRNSSFLKGQNNVL